MQISRYTLLPPRFWAEILTGAVSTAAAAEINLNSCSDGAGPPDEIAVQLDRLLSDTVDPDSAYAADGLLAPGAVLFVRTPDWTYFKSAGVSDLQTSEPFDCQSPYQIGSTTKMMTGTVVIQLQEEGRLSLDDLLSTHLPEIAARLPNGDRITLRQMANHTAGLFNYTDNAADGTPGLMESEPTTGEERIRFDAGTTGTELSATLTPGSSTRYLLGAKNEQFLYVRVASTAPGMSYQIFNPDGSFLLDMTDSAQEYRCQLWQSGDHMVEVINRGQSNASYNLIVGIE